MPPSSCLYVAVSYHGFGHVAQTGPIVNELARRRPDIRVFVQCAAPLEVLHRHFECEFEPIAEAPDIGMRMANSLDTLVEESYAAYVGVHAAWQEHAAREAARLAAIRPTLVLANVPYLVLAAAFLAGIPSAAVCSLNWAEIFYPYCKAMPQAGEIYQQIVRAYRAADLFLNPMPSMPMPSLGNARPLGPIARTGQNRRPEIDRKLGLNPADKLVVLFMGGIFTALPVAEWPALKGINLLVSGTDTVNRPGVFPVEATGMSHIDAFCSADALVTKPGYGGFAEAACNGVPVLYTRRRDWPEEPYLVRWLQDHANCLELARADLEKGRLSGSLEALWAQPAKSAVAPTGAKEAADLLQPYFGAPR